MSATMPTEPGQVALRPVIDADLPHFLRHQQDPVAQQMAAFVAEDAGEAAAFALHWAHIRADPGVTVRTITLDARVVGHIAAFTHDGDTEVTYWLDRTTWGRGVASRALALLLELVPTRPLFAWVAADNAGSLHILQRAGFQVIETAHSFAPARGTTIDEHRLRLDLPCVSCRSPQPGAPCRV